MWNKTIHTHTHTHAQTHIHTHKYTPYLLGINHIAALFNMTHQPNAPPDAVTQEVTSDKATNKTKQAKEKRTNKRYIWMEVHANKTSVIH